MPMGTGATPLLDAPEAAAVAALIAAAPANAHALGGVSHNADTLANLNTKLSDATLLALAGQLGGSAGAPDVRGIRETGTPDLLTIGAILDHEMIRRAGTTVEGSNFWAAHVGLDPNDFGEIRDAANALNITPRAKDGRIYVAGDKLIGTAGTLEKPAAFIGTEFGSGPQASISVFAILTFASTTFRGIWRWENLKLNGATAAAHLLVTATECLFVFERCRLDRVAAGSLLQLSAAGAKISILCIDCDFNMDDAARVIFDLTAANQNVDLFLHGCGEVGGTAAGSLVKVAATSVCNLHVLDGTNLPTLVASGAGTVNFRRDGSSNMPEASLTATTVNIDRVAGDQIRETSGPSLLTVGAIPNNEFLKRVGSTVVGAVVASRQVSDEMLIRAAPSAPPPSEITSGDLVGFELIDGATRAVLGDHVKPVKFDLTVDPVLDIHFVVSNPGAVAGNVRFQLLVRYIDNGELTTKAVDETLLLTKAVINTLNEHHTAGFTLDKTKISPTDHHISFKLERLGADGLDTFDGDIAILTAAQLQFTRGS